MKSVKKSVEENQLHTKWRKIFLVYFQILAK